MHLFIKKFLYNYCVIHGKIDSVIDNVLIKTVLKGAREMAKSIAMIEKSDQQEKGTFSSVFVSCSTRTILLRGIDCFSA